MFLKRIELQGFKSFADKTVITFDSDVIGIVGPNGCGKSNINDAIRWVLGEQSVKSLRGTSMSDVIFSGSDTRKAVNMAEVTLVFDNTLHFLHVDYEEVEITRRLHRSTGEGEYFLNRTPCRLKDIQNLIMDTGLGRDSLSIISQGTISSFAESKPEERRGLFEEAAGVAKYKKRKIESLGKLNRTQENLDRLEDIIMELERQVAPLKRQAKKAETYIEKKQELEAIEISVLVDEIEHLNEQIEEGKKKAFDLQSKKALHETTIAVSESKNLELKQEMSVLDREVNQLQDEFMKIMSEIQALDARKTEIDEKRKYAMASANAEIRAKELKVMIEEAQYEFNDRSSRLNELNVDLKLNQDKTEKLSNDANQCSIMLNEQSSYLNNLINRRSVLENLVKQPFNHQQGVKAILEVKDSLNGVLGVVSQILKPHDDYENAVSNAIGGALYHIVTEDEMSARHAITYLKKNASGRATFLPITVLKPRSIFKEHEIIAKNSVGYLGTASEFVDCEDTFTVVRDSLMGNVLVCDNLINANELARTLKYNYKIVTLDGDVVHKGGSMSGGKVKDSYSPMSLQKELDQIHDKIDKQQVKVNKLRDDRSSLASRSEALQAAVMQLRIDIAQLQPVVDAKKAKVDRLKAEYEELRPGEFNDEEAVSEDNLVAQLSNAYSKRDAITSQLKIKRDRRSKAGSEVERNDVSIRNLRRECNALLADEREYELNSVKAETMLDNALNRLSSSYEMTFEYAQTQKLDTDIEEARKRVQILRQEINALGNVNLDAPAQYEEVSGRFEFLTKQKADLIAAKDKILEAIDEMDQVMIKQFKEMFDKINAELNDVFRTLFGGGRASLVLVDPNDILNTGIDIDVQPPGKNVQNIKLFSGGEKSLIAICVLFAILKARTMPLCIFDEVEAALDQANVERFAKYISHFRGESQFIVVTHRPGTMAQCDALYGVTMKQNGVSSLLKVQLQEAMQYVDKKEVSA